MQRITYTSVAVCCLALGFNLLMRGQSPDVSIAGASVAQLISFSAVVKDASGQPLRGEVTLIFSLYGLPDGGSPLWVESQNVQMDEQGHYTVVLGSASPSGLPLDLFVSHKALWLGVQPQLPGQGEQPRILLAAVPYALKAVDADTLGGKPASAYVTVESESPAGPGAGSVVVGTSEAGAVSKPTPTASKSLPSPKLSSCPVSSSGAAPINTLAIFKPTSCNVESSIVFQSGTNVGIGTTAPAANLEVNGTAQFDGPIALNSRRVGLTASFSNSGSVYYLDQIKPAGVPGAGPFTVNYHTASFNGTPDPAIGIGYNQSLSGNQIVPNEPGISLNMESNYNDGVEKVMEVYWQYVSADNSKRIRPFYFNVDRATNASEMSLQKDGGNVGIDTTAALATLHVQGDNYSPPAANPGINGTPGLIVTSQFGGAALSGSNSGGDGGSVYLSSGSGGPSTGTAANSKGGDITLQVGSAGTGGSGGPGRPGYLLLNPRGGKVGIGTLTPAASLDVENGSTVLNGGNVGIGTATPSATLEVNGTAQFDQGLAGTAASFSGNVSISGNLSVGGTVSKGGGSFKIDHPLNPANKYLSHSFVESPDMMDIYNGNVVTNEKGEAEVVLPAYFEALNRDFRYQLTVIGQFAQAIVGSKIKNNRFTIRTDKPGVEVSWQVTGIRHDAWANAHRIGVEEEKKPEERGHYLAPEAFGERARQEVSLAGNTR